jgi:hypothetical protein
MKEKKSYQVKLKNIDNLGEATNWCIDNLETKPHVKSAWMRAWSNRGYDAEQEIHFYFVDENWAIQFALMGF